MKAQVSKQLPKILLALATTGLLILPGVKSIKAETLTQNTIKSTQSMERLELNLQHCMMMALNQEVNFI